MGKLGFLTFGVTVIWLARMLLDKMQGSRDRGVVALALLPVCGISAAIFLTPALLQSNAANYFPIGMLLAFIWLGMKNVVQDLDAKNRIQNWLNAVQLVFACIVTYFLLHA